MSSSGRRNKQKAVDIGISKELQQVTTSLTSESVPPLLNKQEVQKKSRKKQFSVVASVGPNGIQGNLLPEIRKPLIAHLPIQSKDIQIGTIFSTTSYDHRLPIERKAEA